MDVKATAKHIHMSPQKVRLVIDVIRGKCVADAQTQLRFMKKAAALPVLKLLNSAAANASHNFKLDVSTLFVKSITADGGPIIHRVMPRAQGRATPIRKRTTHIAIVLGEKATRKTT
ncbi:50S ribosomal protein L22 [Candidatus Uhrbacteria bacterium]|nr:50S ribosomal protein L22 [Candidatus Uhrbacteria bacterium]